MLPTAQPTCFLIADISGYTGYLADVELDHAQDILADLIGGVVTALMPNFRLAKLEGDAAFMFVTTEQIDGSMLLDTIERCYFGFRRRRRDVRQATSCECNACLRIPDLDLKFVVHHGSAIRQKVAGRKELLGSDVIVVHRLLKNDVVETAGHRRVRADQSGVHRCVRHRPGRARHARAHRDLRPDRRRAGLGPRPRAPLAGGGGPGPRPRRARGFHPHRVGADERTAAGGLGVPHQARAADELAALGDGGHDQGSHRRTARARLGQPLHARQGCRRRGDPRLAPLRLRHGSDDPRHPERAGEGRYTPSSWSRTPTGP